MSDNPFDELLRDFRAAYAKYGNEFFYLFAVTGEELDANRSQIEDFGQNLGCVPLCESSSSFQGYWIFGTTRRFHLGWRERWDEPLKVFQNLVARAGASLSLNILEKMPVRPATPVSAWLNYMWLQKPPTAEQLEVPDVSSGGVRIIWIQPFAESAEAIERGRLCSDTERREPLNVAVDDNDIKILGTLARFPNRLFKTVELTEMSSRTAKEKVNRLIRQGLVVRPEGPKKGAQITRAGLALLHRVQAGKSDSGTKSTP